MRLLVFLAFASISSACSAGGPAFQARDVLVSNIERGPGGIIMTLSGVGQLFVAKPADEVDESGNARMIRLKMDRTQIIYTGDELHSVGNTTAHEQRLKAMVGTRIATVQAWGISATIEGGQLVRVFARHVYPLAPTPEEAAFRYDRLDSLRNK